MVTVLCMLWVANMTLACMETNTAWVINSAAACVVTVCLVGALV